MGVKWTVGRQVLRDGLPLFVQCAVTQYVIVHMTIWSTQNCLGVDLVIDVDCLRTLLKGFSGSILVSAIVTLLRTLGGNPFPRKHLHFFLNRNAVNA